MSTVAVDFQLLDNGSVKFSAQPVDAIGEPATLPAGASTPVWASSDPNLVVVAAADGLSAVGTPTAVPPATLPALVSGVVVTVTSTLADGTTTITGSAVPVDIVAGAAGSFAVTES